MGFKERVLGLLVLIWMALRNTRSELCKGFGRTYTQLVISYKSPPKCFTSALYLNCFVEVYRMFGDAA